LPSLFDEHIAKVVSPESEIIVDSASKLVQRHSQGGQLGPAIKGMISTQTLNLRNLRKLDQEATRERNRSLTQRKLKQLQPSARTLQPASPKLRGAASPLHAFQVGFHQDDIIKNLGTTKRLHEFAQQITGPDPEAPQTALYYRKDLSYIDKLLPEIKVASKLLPQLKSPIAPMSPLNRSPSNSTLRNVQSPFLKPIAKTEQLNSPLSQITQKDILESFKQPVILKQALRGPKFELTDYAQYLADRNDSSLMKAEGQKQFALMSDQLREMFDQIL